MLGKLDRPRSSGKTESLARSSAGSAQASRQASSRPRAVTVPHGTRAVPSLPAVVRHEIKSRTARHPRLELQTDSHATPSVGRRQSQETTTGMDAGGGSFAANETGPIVAAEVWPSCQRRVPIAAERSAFVSTSKAVRWSLESESQSPALNEEGDCAARHPT